MSHFTRIKTRIVSLDHLKAALTDLGYAFQEGRHRIRGYGGQTTAVEIKIPTRSQGYDLGFVREGEAYTLVADWYGIHDIKQDVFLRQLTQRYAYHAVREQLAEQDFNLVEETVDQDQRIHLVLRRMT